MRSQIDRGTLKVLLDKGGSHESEDEEAWCALGGRKVREGNGGGHHLEKGASVLEVGREAQTIR